MIYITIYIYGWSRNFRDLDLPIFRESPINSSSFPPTICALYYIHPIPSVLTHSKQKRPFMIIYCTSNVMTFNPGIRTPFSTKLPCIECWIAIRRPHSILKKREKEKDKEKKSKNQGWKKKRRKKQRANQPHHGSLGSK